MFNKIMRYKQSLQYKQKKQNGQLPFVYSISPLNLNIPSANTHATKPLEHVLRIKCPNNRCMQDIILACKRCHRGELIVNTDSYNFYCSACHHICKEVVCSCGFALKASVVENKKYQLNKLREHADKGQFWVALIASLSVIAILWIILGLQPPLLVHFLHVIKIL